MESKITYLFDTDILVGILRRQSAAIDKIEMLNEAKISSLSIFELIEGSHRSNNPQKAEYEALSLISKLEELPADKEVCILAGKIAGTLMKKGLQIGDGDMLIAATALMHNLTVVTRNAKHFRSIPDLKVEEW